MYAVPMSFDLYADAQKPLINELKRIYSLEGFPADRYILDTLACYWKAKTENKHWYQYAEE